MPLRRTNSADVQDSVAHNDPSGGATSLVAPRPWWSRAFRLICGTVKNHLLTSFIVAYFLIISGATIATRSWLTSDQFIIIGMALAILLTRSLAIVRDWAPFGMLLLGYSFLRGLAPSLGMEVNIFPMIRADLLIFGELPTVTLQRMFYNLGSPGWLDYGATLLYLLHFVVPVLFAFLLYLNRREHFRPFAVALIVLSYLAFTTYVLYPAMPPWMASNYGYIPAISNIFEQTLATLGDGPAVPRAIGFVRSNPVAAMPSLHAAYPMLVFLFAVRVWGRKAAAFLLYPAAVWFAIVYLGHHYVIDAFAGIVYALGAFHAMEWVAARRALREARGVDRIAEPEMQT